MKKSKTDKIIAYHEAWQQHINAHCDYLKNLYKQRKAKLNKAKTTKKKSK